MVAFSCLRVQRDVVISFLLRLLRVATWGYLLGLLVVLAYLRFANESYWLSTLLLYLPRFGFGLPIVPLTVALWYFGLRRLLLTQLAALLLVLFPLMGLELAWNRKPDPGEPVLTMMTCNIQHGYQGLDKLVAEIVETAPDLMVMQEADGVEIEKALRERWPGFSFDSTNQFVLVSRGPITAVHEQPKLLASGAMRSPRFIVYTVETKLGPVDLYNVHPISPRDALDFVRGELRQMRRGNFEGSPDGEATAINAELRRVQVEAIARHARTAKNPVLIGGDTNLPGLSRLLKQNFGTYADGFAESGWGFGYTFPTYRRAWLRLDRIMAGPEFEFTGFRVGPGHSSDHACVSAKITRRR